MKKTKFYLTIGTTSALVAGLMMFLLISLSSCNEADPYSNQQGFLKGTATVKEASFEDKIQVIEYDGCEYIIYSSFSGYSGFGYMAHKGNCKNPIHKHNQ